MFSLGLTADAAAAHRQHESSPSRFPSERGSALVRQVLHSPSLPPLKVTLDALEGSSYKRKSLPAMLKEQSTYGSSDEDYSRSNSLQSQTTSQAGSSSKRKRERPKTSFHLAHPPPVTKQKQKLRIRPRLLLQLQQLSEAARPTPALDVLPSTIFAPRLASRFPRAFKGKDSLGTNDLIIVSSESYESSRVVPEDDKSDSSEEEAWDHREVIGTICQLPKMDGGTRGKVEISFNQGSAWEGTPLVNGSYEFVTTDKNGLQTMARWVPRSKARRRTSTLAPSHGSVGEDDKKFTFSLVNPSTRRHPVIASMTRTSIDVSDQYPPSASASPRSTTSPTLSPASFKTHDTSYFEALDLPDQVMVKTDDHLRTLIVATGVWVAFRENWSKNFTYNDAMAVTLGSANNSTHHRRHTSNGQDTIRQEQRNDTFHTTPKGGLHNMSDNIRRTSTNLLRRSSPAPAASQTRNATSPAPRRSYSTGAAFIEKANRRSVSLARKSRQTYPAASSGESEEEHYGHISGISTPTKAALRASLSANQALSISPDMDLVAKIAEKKRVQIEEPKREDASDDTTLVDSAAVQGAAAAMMPSLNGVNNPGKGEQTQRKRWRRVSRVFSFLSRSNGG